MKINITVGKNELQDILDLKQTAFITKESVSEGDKVVLSAHNDWAFTYEVWGVAQGLPGLEPGYSLISLGAMEHD